MAFHSQDTEETYTRCLTAKFNPNLTTICLFNDASAHHLVTSPFYPSHYTEYWGRRCTRQTLCLTKPIPAKCTEPTLYPGCSNYFRAERSWFWNTHLEQGIYIALWHCWTVKVLLVLFVQLQQHRHEVQQCLWAWMHLGIDQERAVTTCCKFLMYQFIQLVWKAEVCRQKNRT